MNTIQLANKIMKNINEKALAENIEASMILKEELAKIREQERLNFLTKSHF